MRPKFYYEGHHKAVANKIKEYLNSYDHLLSPQTTDSPRAVGDALESIVSDKFADFLDSWCKDYSSEFARRAMADLAFTDDEGFYSIVDVKTHRKDTSFNMPNLTSVERLTRFYESDDNVFSVLMIQYKIDDTSMEISDVIFSPIEFLDWDCLTIGALGWGQIQIANSNKVNIRENRSRKEWMLELCDVMMNFYPREIEKIGDRISRFESVKNYWSRKTDIWSD